MKIKNPASPGGPDSHMKFPKPAHHRENHMKWIS